MKLGVIEWEVRFTPEKNELVNISGNSLESIRIIAQEENDLLVQEEYLLVQEEYLLLVQEEDLYGSHVSVLAP